LGNKQGYLTCNSARKAVTNPKNLMTHTNNFLPVNNNLR